MATWDPNGMVLEPADLQEAPYSGRAGATRVESVHVPLANGTLRVVAVHRGVHVGTDPHLREVVLGGRLHQVEGGAELAVPFVYHDPGVRKLALVVPEALRHDELRERARFLSQLADESSIPVPRYVAEATVVIGVAQLAEYLATPSARGARARDEADLLAKRKELGAKEQELLGREEILAEREETIGQREEALARREAMLSQHEPSLAQREQALTEREQAIGQREHALTPREHRMRERAEEVTRREDELAGMTEEHEASQRDLAMREQELEQRLESLVQREQEVAQRQAELDRREHDPARAHAPRPLSSPPAAMGFGAGAAAPLEMGDEVASIDDADDDVEELEELEAIRTNTSFSSDAMAISSTLDGTIGLAEDAVEEIVDDDDVEEEVDDDDLEASADGTDDELAAGPKTLIAPARDAADEVPGPSTDPGIVPPEGLGGDFEMIARIGEGVELYIALGEHTDAFEGETDLLIQLAVIEGCPVVLLALLDPTGGRPFVRRAAFDPRAPEGRRLLEALRRHFEARTIFFGPDGRFLRVGRVAAPRELNASRTLDRVSKLRGEAGVDPSVAIERALAAPPPISGANPFASEEDPNRFETAQRSAAALAELAEWVTPEKMDHALLVLSVPRDTIDATFARVMERAVGHGLALPSSLVERSLGAGLASDASSLVTQQIEGFRRTVALPDRGGLSDEAIATNWEKLLAGAAEAEVAIDSETHDSAWRAIRVVRGENTGSMPGGEVDSARLAQMGSPELVMLLEHPRHRRAAALALAERGDSELADTICKAVRKMPRAEVVRVVPRVTKLGDEAGDALIDGLGARKTFARQAFALALGHLKLRRAVVPLLHLLTSEPSDVWREIARVYGTFGNASFRTLSQKLHDPKAPEERYVLTLAHLANHGCAKQVDALQKDADPLVARMAMRAHSMRDDARRQEELVSGKRPLDGSDDVIAFSRRFAEELEGTAPESDLAALPGEDT